MVIQGALQGNSALVLMPTGMGKSLCYQIPTFHLPGLTLVISPLIALMKDQVDRAVRLGIKATYINSSLSGAERNKRYASLSRGSYRLLYVAPERFRKTEFQEALSGVEVSLVAVDEAHCVSQWGHDFRPDYSRIGEFRKLLKDPTTLALTATATPDVQKDILTQLGLPSTTAIFSSGMERPNLEVSIHNVWGEDEKVRAFIGLRSQAPGPAIVYFALISSLESFSKELRKLNVDHQTYHGQLPARLRKTSQEAFLAGDATLMLATPAFGLGIDKPDIRMIVHHEIPISLEAYYQEIGRGGRDGNPCQCHLLYDENDLSTQMDFIKWNHPEPSFVMALFALLRNHPERVQQEGLDFLRGQMHFYNSRDFRIETALNLLDRWGCTEGSLSQKNLKLIEAPDKEFLDQTKYDTNLRCQQEKLLKMVELTKTQDCRMVLIYRYFGLLTDQRCEKCDRCLSRS